MNLLRADLQLHQHDLQLQPRLSKLCLAGDQTHLISL